MICMKRLHLFCFSTELLSLYLQFPTGPMKYACYTQLIIMENSMMCLEKKSCENEVRLFIYSVSRRSVCTALCAHGLPDCNVTLIQGCLHVIYPDVNVYIQRRARAFGRTYLNRHLCTIFTVPHDDTKFN